MFKKSLAVAMAVTMIASSMVGCSQSGTTETTGTATETTSTASAEEDAEPAETEADSEEAEASGYPEHEIEWLVPYTAGGSSDQMARLIAKYSKQYLGVDIVIENVGGGGGNVGLSQFVTTPNVNDGYNITCFNTTANLQLIYGTCEYDWLEELEPLALCVSIPIAIAVPKDSPFNTIEELIDYAKEHPGEIQYGHAGIGSITNVAGEQFCLEAGISMTAVPFGSGADALTAIMGSQIDVDVASLSEVLSYGQTGELKLLALCTDTQIESMPEVPTLVSKGYEVDQMVTQGIATAKDTPADMITVLDKGLGEIIADENFQKELETYGMDVQYMNAADFGTFLQEQREVFTQVVTDSGILELVQEQTN